MKNTLQELIDALQSECDLLEEELVGCLLERDYKSADKLDKALSYTRSQLAVLKNLENPEHAKIQTLKNKIQMLRIEQSSVEHSEKYRYFIQNTIAALENELAKLEDKKNHSFQDSDEVIQCLSGIISGTILGFIIQPLDKPFFIELTTVDTDLKIEIKTINNDTLKHFLSKSGFYSLKKQGFKINGKTAQLIIREFDSGKILSVMELLSVIFFEAFLLLANKRALIKIIS